MPNLTEKMVAGFKAGATRVHVPDGTKGFILRVESLNEGGRKIFYFLKKVNGTVKSKNLGEWPATTVDAARDAAIVWLAKVSHWKAKDYAADSDPFARPKAESKSTNGKTFKQLLDAYISDWVNAEANHPDKAARDLRKMFDRHCEGWTERRLEDITNADVCAVKEKLGKAGHFSMANGLLGMLKAVYNWANDTSDNGKPNFEGASANPAATVKRFTGRNEIKKPRARYILPEEMSYFLAALETEQDVELKDFLTLLKSTGARKENICGLRYDEINFGEQTATLKETKTESYTIPLLPGAMQVLERRRALAKKAGFFFPCTGDRKSKTGHCTNFDTRWWSFLERAAVDCPSLTTLTLHDVRRTKGAYLGAGGASTAQIGVLLGHAKNSKATAIYEPHITIATRENAVNG